MRGGSLICYARNVYSQNGEDGIVAELIRRLDIRKPGTFVEFGAGNGVDLSNTLNLANQGWSGVWIEANEDSAARAAEHVAEHGLAVEVLNDVVGFGQHNNLDVILSCTKVPKDIDVLSIDIDSDDLIVWEAVQAYRAKIVIIEINSGVPLGDEQVHDFSRNLQGNSFTSMLKLAYKKGYRLVCHTGNLIFIDEKFTPMVRLPARELQEPNSIFNDMWAQWAAAEKK